MAYDGTDGSIAYGATLTLATDTIREITNIGGIELTADTVEMTNHQSTDRYREFLQGLRDGGEFSVEGNHIAADAGQVAIMTQFHAATPAAAVFTMADGANWTADVIVTAYSPGDAPVDGAIQFTATFKVTGKPTYDDGIA